MGYLRRKNTFQKKDEHRTREYKSSIIVGDKQADPKIELCNNSQAITQFRVYFDC